MGTILYDILVAVIAGLICDWVRKWYNR